MALLTMNLAWYDWVGVIGTLMVLGAFFWLQTGHLSGTGLVYQLLNLFGAGGVLISLVGKFNVSVFLLEGTWVAISAYGIWRTLKARQTAAPD
jgi:paired small multidrug resistance pump